MKKKLIQHQAQLKQCAICKNMVGKPVHGQAVVSPIMLIGQAPGIKEADLDKPFAWTAGKTLFKWFDSIGVGEEQFRQQVYMTAICRCFPGKSISRQGKIGGDRVPSKDEIENCSRWLREEIQIIQPQLVILIGKLAINQVISVDKLTDIIGTQHTYSFHGHSCDFIALPHPSGASTWFRREPGIMLLANALKLIDKHPAWQEVFMLKSVLNSTS